MKNKIYIVIGSFSSYDSGYERNLKAFSLEEDAVKYSEKADRVLGEMSKHIESAFRKTSPPDEDDISYDEYEQTDEYKLALNIWAFHHNLEEFNKCKIQELELI